MLSKGTRILLLRFSNYKKNNFIQCHKDIIDEYGYAWMMKAGKQLPQTSISPVVDDGGTIILKEPKASGGGFFVAKILDFYNGAPPRDELYPAYYHQMEKDENLWMLNYSLDGSWFMITDLESLSDEEAGRLRLISNGRLAVDVLRSTRTSVMYVTV